MDVVMRLFGVRWGRGDEEGVEKQNEAAIQFYGGIADPLRAIPKRDAYLISHLGSNKPIETHCNWITQLM